MFGRRGADAWADNSSCGATRGSPIRAVCDTGRRELELGLGLGLRSRGSVGGTRCTAHGAAGEGRVTLALTSEAQEEAESESQAQAEGQTDPAQWERTDGIQMRLGRCAMGGAGHRFHPRIQGKRRDEGWEIRPVSGIRNAGSSCWDASASAFASSVQRSASSAQCCERSEMEREAPSRPGPGGASTVGRRISRGHL